MKTRLFICLALALISASGVSQSIRIKDIANVRGVRTNPLVGFGLVVGLSGTGDSKKSLTTNQAAANMLSRLGMHTKPKDVVSGNIAAVAVTAELSPFARIGDTLDVKVSAVGDAKSLAGGTLILTPLKAGDSHIYAVAQGSVVVGQATGQGAKVLTVAAVPSGATIEREFLPDLAGSGKILLSLKNPDFVVAKRVQDAVNTHFRGFFAKSNDPASVELTVPLLYKDKPVEFVAKVESLTVVIDKKAIVMVNERTGTVVMGAEVHILPVSVAHGDLAIDIGKAAKDKAPAKAVVNLPGSTVGELIETLNAMGAKPSDLTGILQAVHAAGALQAELKFM